MDINSIFKRENIIVKNQIDTLRCNIIINNVSNKLAARLYEHNLSKAALFAKLSKLTMYIGDIPQSSAKAKYIPGHNVIVFAEDLSNEELSDISVHECIHYIQEIENTSTASSRLGLASFQPKPKGIALNEAAVQLMASESNKLKSDIVTYYNITFPTISPNYYSLECVLVHQMTYFTGTHSLYNSALYSNDTFKNTFSQITSSRIFKIIDKNLDKLVAIQDLLYVLTMELQESTEDVSKVKHLNTTIAAKKQEIFNLFLKTQNIIMTNGFNYEFKNIKTIADFKKFKSRLYNFQHLIGFSSEYMFYKDFFYYCMKKLEHKEEILTKDNSAETIFKPITSLVLFENHDNIFSRIKLLLRKITILFKKEEKENIGDTN